MHNSSNIHIMSSALLKASKTLRRDFNEIEKLQNSNQGTAKFVFTSIKNIKESIFLDLQKARSEAKVEFIDSPNETQIIKKNNYKFIVNPVSGANNYANGISYFALSVALIIDDETIASVIYDPIKDDMFCAEKGKGAFINNIRMRVSSVKTLNEALIVLEDITLLEDPYLKKSIFKNCTNIKIFGGNCLDFANLATGKIDCYLSKNLQEERYTSGKLFIRESGGIKVNISDSEIGIITNNNLSSKFE